MILALNYVDTQMKEYDEFLNPQVFSFLLFICHFIIFNFFFFCFFFFLLKQQNQKETTVQTPNSEPEQKKPKLSKPETSKPNKSTPITPKPTPAVLNRFFLSFIFYSFV